MLRLRQGLPRLTVDLPLYSDAKVHTPVQARWLERPVDHESRVIGIHPYRNQNRLAGSDDMNVRWFHGGAVDSVALDGNDCGFSAINRERHVESIAVPVVENAEKPIRGTTAVMRRPRFQSMHEHALHDIVIANDKPSGLPPVAVRPPHAHDSGYDCDDSRSPSRPIANFNGRKHKNDSKENLMNNEIRKFDFKGASLRTLTDEAGEPWFVAKDVCDVLGYTNASKAINDHVDQEDKLNNESLSSLGQRGGWLVNESGLYSLVLSSKLPTAKEFKRWVTHDVLPQIRRTGGYIPTSESDSDEDIMARAVLVAQKTIERKNQQIAEQQTRIDELQPKASMWDNFVDIPDVLSVGNSAKLLSNLGRPIGRKTLFSWLEHNGWVFRENGHWSARQNRIDAGHLVMVPPKTHGTHRDGTTFSFAPTVKITRKGLGLIARRMSEATLQLEYTKAGA